MPTFWWGEIQIVMGKLQSYSFSITTVLFVCFSISCRLKWVSGQSDFKLAWFVFPLFKEHGDKSGIKEHTNQTTLTSFGLEIHFKLQLYSTWQFCVLLLQTFELYDVERVYGLYQVCLLLIIRCVHIS